MMKKYKKRRIAVVTGIRSEYSLLYPLIRKVHEHPLLDLKLFVTGAHLSKTFGLTVREIEKDGFPIEARIKSLVDSDSLAARVKGAGVQLVGLVQSFERVKPDIVIAPFDREESITVALAGSYMNIPVVHVGAGDKVIGNVDDYVRHAVTKLAHLHFTATEENRKRVIRMGEEPWRVHNVGNLGLDKYVTTEKISKEKLSDLLDFDICRKPLLVVLYHSLSTEAHKAYSQAKIVMDAVNKLGLTTVIILPNSDFGSRNITRVINSFGKKSNIKIFVNLEKEIFVNLLRNADVLAGNSSCGILEAPFIKLPVVNIGKRQTGREHSSNVIFVDTVSYDIVKAIKKAVFDKKFREHVEKCKNPYGNGRAAEKIIKVLTSVKIDDRLLQKDIT